MTRHFRYWFFTVLAICVFGAPGFTATEETILRVNSRFGAVLVARSTEDCCSGYVKFGNQRIEIELSGEIYANLEGTFQTHEGDVIVLSVPSGARGMPASYYVLLISQSKMIDLADHKTFTSGDGTFRATQRGNEIHFDLGWENRKRKTAFYRAGVIYVGSNNAQTATSLGKKDCEYVLTTLASCQRTCPSDDFMDMSVQRNFNSLEEKPAFKAENFFRLCKTGCNGTKLSVPTARKELCGY